MKNTYKSFALLCMGFAALACVEENFENDYPKFDTTPGNEIVFTASAGIENGMPKTKTEYGDKDEVNKLIEINWVDGDRISIVSPQAAGADVAHYQVSATSQNNDQYDGPHKASQLTRLGDAGLQWTAEDKYDFYAVYPSVLGDNTASLTKEGVFTGTMPRDQTYKRLDDATDENGKAGKIAVPNMDYAFMTATGEYSRVNEDGAQNSEAINLQFESLVTALQFDITAGDIKNVFNNVEGGNVKVEALDIISISLISSANNIYGNFQYDFDPEEGYSHYSGTHNGSTKANRVIMHFEDTPVSLKPGEFLDVTFFVLPAQIKAKDLTLQILFKLGATTMSRSAVINKELEGGKKYCFNDVKLEDFDFTDDITPGSWFDTLDSETLVSQLSIPVASNVFATTANGFDAKSVQQVLDLDRLWEVGVRGFELVNRRYIYNSRYPYKQYTLGNAHFVCDEVVYESSTINFDYAFKKLTDKLTANPKEFLVLLCTYQASGDGYNPDVYVTQLLNYLDDFVASGDNPYTKDDFIQITSSTTVAQAQGAIAVLIRPGDDDRYGTETDSSDQVDYGNSSKSTSAISLTSNDGNDWSKNVTLIEDWGTAFDVWDRRYEGVARESSFETEYYWGKQRTANDQSLIQIEDWLWGVSSRNNNYVNVNNYHNFNNGIEWPTKLDEFDYQHSVKGPGGIAYVQEWARVANGEVYQYTEINRSSRYLWVKWPDSFVE